jgi:hypothetical protein
MKVTNKCKACGKRYKLPMSPSEKREHYCFSCEFAHEMISAVLITLETSYLNGTDALLVFAKVSDVNRKYLLNEEK